MKLKKATQSVMSRLEQTSSLISEAKFPADKTYVTESIMADLDLLAQESKTYKEFEKKFMQDYSDGKMLSPDEVELLKQLYNTAKGLSETKKSKIIEVTSQPVSREILTMIFEVASDYGVKKLPKKQWSSTTKLIQFICEKIDKTQRTDFLKNIKLLRESMGIEEFVIDSK